MRKILLTLGALLPFMLSAQLVTRSVTATNGEKIGFWEFRPSDYNSTSGKLPVIIFLHGTGERGNGTTQLADVATVGLPKYIKDGRTMRFNFNGKWQSFIVLAPQCSASYSSWQPFYVDEMIKWAVNNMKGDPNRIILTGLSMGGGGTWAYPSASTANASKLAAIVPVCGTCSMSNANNIASSKVAVWAFHSTNDDRVSYSCAKNAVDNIAKANPLIKPLLTSYTTGGHIIWNFAYDSAYNYQNPNVFEWMLGQDRSLAVNKLPTANAGSNITISTATAKATLAGSGTDADGSIVRYIWKKIAGPSAGTLSNKLLSNPVVTGLTTAGTYQYELTVVDSRGSWDRDTMSIVVSTGAPLPNVAPVAKAGANVTITLPTSSVTLNGSGSTDSDGSIASYAWSKVSGPTSGTISSPTAASTTVTALVQGTYTFRLTVKDNVGASSTDDVVVTVNAATTTNQVPLAKAGANITITLPTSSTSLNGASSSDPDGSIVSYQWTKMSGPTSYTFSSASSAFTNLTNLTSGTYVFRLTVTDNKGAEAHDDIAVYVLGSSGTPVAKAGLNVTINLPSSSVSLNGSASYDPNGSISKYNWKKMSGPAATITSPSAASTTITGLVQGTYVFRLTVTDNSGLTDFDDIAVYVNSSATGAANLSTTSAVEVLDANPGAGVVSDNIAVSPNPAHSYLNVQLSAMRSGNSAFMLYDVQGRLVSKMSFIKSQAVELKNLDISKLAPGLYHLEATVDGKIKLVTKFIKQ